MGGRNNKLCDQKGQDPKGVRQAKKPIKRNPAVGQKEFFRLQLPFNYSKIFNSNLKKTSKKTIPTLDSNS